MTTTIESERIAEAWLDANVRITRATPLGRHVERGDATALVSRSRLATLNLAVSVSPSPDLGALDAMAAVVAAYDVPWAIQVRPQASEAVAELAARYGLTGRSDIDVMACTCGEAVLAAEAGPSASIRPVTSDAAAEYTVALAEGFEVPAGLFGSLMGGAVLDVTTGYLAGPRGWPDGTALGIAGESAIGVYNIAVAPRARGRGLGRALTARVMADGFAGGADLAYMHASEAGRPLYESMGFRHVELWTAFSAPSS